MVVEEVGSEGYSAEGAEGAGYVGCFVSSAVSVDVDYFTGDEHSGEGGFVE